MFMAEASEFLKNNWLAVLGVILIFAAILGFVIYRSFFDFQNQGPSYIPAPTNIPPLAPELAPEATNVKPLKEIEIPKPTDIPPLGTDAKDVEKEEAPLEPVIPQPTGIKPL